VIVDAVTTRYAGALYGLAQRTGVLAEVARDVESIERELASGASRTIVFNPRVEREAKRAQLAPLLARMQPLTRNFVQLLLDKNRVEVLRGVGDSFRRRALEERGAVEGVAETARAIGAAELATIAASVGARIGKQVELSNRVVPELVGGVRVIAANRMIDYSVQGRLDGLRRKMMDVKLPSATGR
jgi:F-type H+-transporting ATPase subunit delta